MAAHAIEVLETPPERFPFEGEKGEYLATFGLALACHGDTDRALALAADAEVITRAVEARTLVPCVRSITALRERTAGAQGTCFDAFRVVLETGNIDAFVTAYRAWPELLSAIAEEPSHRDLLRDITDAANDSELAKRSGLSPSRGGRTSKLSPREGEVLGLMAQGLTNREIAKTLFISESTAKLHVRHILGKLGVRSRIEAVLRALEGTETD
jgi:ATP/maltotriose-dependent transcriptional regulator MalT